MKPNIVLVKNIMQLKHRTVVNVKEFKNKYCDEY